MKLDRLLLQTGGAIAFPQARVTIHQPILKEIGFIGEENFHMGCHLLTFDKNKILDEDKSGLENQGDFDILMSELNRRGSPKHKTDAMLVLALLFPEHKIKIDKDQIFLQLENCSSSICKQNYEDFRDILNQMFCLVAEEGDGQFNPGDALAARIAEKIKKAQEKRKKKREDVGKLTTIYDKYVSILSVGLQKDKNELSNYTVYQLRDEYKRFLDKLNWDSYIQAKSLGATDIEEVENWMSDLHP